MKKLFVVSCLAVLTACAPPASSGGGRGGGADAGTSGDTGALECTRSTDCQQGFRCVNNACEEVQQGCTEDRDCALGEQCNDAGECVPAGNNNGCTTNADCTEQGQVCDSGTCKSAAYGQCTTDADCAAGTGCLLADSDGVKYCGTLCQQHGQCSAHEQCMQGTVCAQNVCQAAGQACDAHATGDGLCVNLGQNNFCIAGAANGAGCAPFDAPSCANGQSCQPLSLTGSDTYCARTGNTPAGSPCESGMAAGMTPFSGDDCAQGAMCVALQQGTACIPYCRVGQNADCPTVDGQALNCTPLSELDPQLAGSPWGICQGQ
jgi:hypothetical protein